MPGTCKSRPLRAIRNTAQYKYFLIATALSCGLPIATSAQTTTPAQTAPQPLGKLVDVGGYRVHLYCTGSGSPILRSSSSALDSLSIGGLFSPKSPNLLRCARMIIPESVGAILARMTRVSLGSARYTRH